MNDDDLPPDEARARDALRSAPEPRLDDVTRRRLVRAALEARPREAPASRPRRRAWRWVGAAAAVIVTVLVVGGLLVSRDDSPTALQEDSASVAGSAPEDEDAPASDEFSLEGAVAALESPEEVLAFADGLVAAEATETPRLASTLACGDALPPDSEVDVSAEATYRDEPVLVVVGRHPAGDGLVYVVATADCRLVETLTR